MSNNSNIAPDNGFAPTLSTLLIVILPLPEPDAPPPGLWKLTLIAPEDPVCVVSDPFNDIKLLKVVSL